MNKLRIQTIIRLARNADTHKIADELSEENFHSIADLVNVTAILGTVIFSSLTIEQQAKVAVALNYRAKRSIIPKLPDETIESFLELMDEDDATDILQFLPHKRHETVLSKIHNEKRERIEKLIEYQPETAGGVMDLNFILVKPDFTLADVADKVERYFQREKKSPLIITSNDDGAIAGYIPYRNLILAKPDSLVKNVTKTLKLISAKTGQRKLLQMVTNKHLEVIGVVDTKDQLLGIIHSSDLSHLIEEEATINLYQFAGVSREEDMLDPASTAIKNRFKWLVVNLGTAFLAAFVVSRFEHTISQLAILAAYMPIVAGMGGNAGTQSLAVVIRGIALGELSWTSGKKIIAKEVIAGLGNGIIVSTVTIPVVWLMTQRLDLALILGSALVFNHVVAGLFGAAIPLTLKMMKIDPAIASSVFVTTATDIFGFLVFLGLATIVLL